MLVGLVGFGRRLAGCRRGGSALLVERATVGADGRGLGWFSLLVAVTALPVSVLAFRDALNTGEAWMAANWLAWAGLWFLYFLMLALRYPVTRQAGWVTLLAGVFTGWLPGFLMIQGAL